MTTHEILVKAKAYLLEHGWRQGDYGSHGERRCIIGAFGSVCGIDDDDDLKWEAWPVEVMGAANAVRRPCIDGEGVADWNDQPGRTFAEVIAALDEAIIKTAPPKPDESPFTALESLPAEQYIDCLSTLALIPAEALA